jgi:D-alanyl-D-alanine carboxypeptidase
VGRIKELEENLNITQNENTKLSTTLESEQNKNSQFAKQIGEITNVVGTLEKLSQTDPELLKKYSKIYFLNENYIPVELTNVDSEYILNKEKSLQIHTEVWTYLEKMLESSIKEGLDIKIISAYRSFGEQASLKSTYSVTYGVGTANQFSADQGYSEHQLGTTLDFTTSKTVEDFSKFKSTGEYVWLQENAYKFGFILSYPETNTYYKFEPWHWRFVGTDLALTLYNEKWNFYDLDQRDIDRYLITLFD